MENLTRIQKPTGEYQGMPPEKAMELLKSGISGLREEEAGRRLAIYGINGVEEKKGSGVREFFRRYWGPMPWLLEFAMVLTFLTGHGTEGVLILILLTGNAVIGFCQSRNSRKAVELLKEKLRVRTQIRRDGRWVSGEAGQIVPGDILKLKGGDLVPADILVVDGELSVDSSAITGESIPRDIRPSGVAWSGSMVRRGEADCLAVNTGPRTYFGKTVSLVQTARPESKQEKRMLEIVRSMMILGIAASAVVSLDAVFLHQGILPVLSLITEFLLGSVPVALPAVLTIVQAVGALELSKKGALVTRLDSIEDASAIDTFCFDKTGTITQNRLSISDIRAFSPFSPDEVIKLAALSSEPGGADAIDSAVLREARARGTDLDGYRRLSRLPFDPSRKRTEAEVEASGRKYRILKGEPRTVADLCHLNPREKEQADRAVRCFSEKGYRAIAVSVREAGENKKFQMAGLLALSDPLRKDSKTMLREIRDLGIRPLMLTGDNLAIAREIAGESGIGSRILRAEKLRGLKKEEQNILLDSCDGFAEAFPEDKYRIVRLLQERGRVVGMTGDGVNDAPALKQAELGTAVCPAADAARASASLVLLKPGLGGILDAISVSRRTSQKMLTWVINKVTKVVETVVLLAAGYFWLHRTLISLLGMSLVVFSNDFVTMSIATDRTKSPRSPDRWEMKNIVLVSSVLGTLFALGDLLAVLGGITLFHLSEEQLGTLIMLCLIFNTQFRILAVRERRHFWSSRPGGKMLAMNLAAVVGFALLGGIGGAVPNLPPRVVAILLASSALFMAAVDFVKYRLFRIFPVSR